MVFAQKNKVNFETFLYRFAVESHHSLSTRIMTVLRGLIGGSAQATNETEFAKRRFFEAVRSASQMGLLPYLMNQVFSKSSDPLTVIAGFEKAIHDAKTHEAVLAPFAKASLWEGRLAEWGDPRQFDRLFADWKGTLKDISDNAFAVSDKSGLKSSLAPAFVQIWGQKLLDFVDLFDRTIKEIKGSPSYTPEKKLLRFKEMLLLYGDLMEKIFAAVPADKVNGIILQSLSEFTPLMNTQA